MSDVIQAPGLYRQKNGKPADVKWVGDGKALGFDQNGDSTCWHAATGKWVEAARRGDYFLHITGPWIPDPPEPPAGFQVMPKEYGYAKGDQKWSAESKTWKEWSGDCFLGWSAKRLDDHYQEEAPFYIASPIPKPFSISEHGIGVYETRDGREEPVIGKATYGWEGNCQNGWYDDGRRVSGIDGPDDLVRYLRPLPKPTVDPGEGWRLLGDEEVPTPQDWHTYGPDPHPASWINYHPSQFNGKTVRELRDSYYENIMFRRRVTPPAPQEWTPTDERISLQKFTNGTDSEWRIV